MNNRTEIVRFLCQKNANVNHKNNNGETALICGILFNLYLNLNYLYIYIFNILASEKGHLTIVQLLCQKKADANVQYKDGRTALIFGILFNLI